MAIDVAALLSLLKDGGILALLLIVLWGGARGIWVWGYVYIEMREDRDRWREIALDGTVLAEKAVDVAHTRSTK